MSGQRVVTKIDSKGIVTVDMQNFNGQGCGALAAKLAANGRTISEETKPEFYSNAENTQEVTQ